MLNDQMKKIKININNFTKHLHDLEIIIIKLSSLFFGSDSRQLNNKSSAVDTAGVNINAASMLLDNAITDRKSQTDAAACFFGGKKRVEETGQVIRVNSRAGIADADLDGPLGVLTGGDCKLPMTGHGLTGIHK